MDDSTWRARGWLLGLGLVVAALGGAVGAIEMRRTSAAAVRKLEAGLGALVPRFRRCVRHSLSRKPEASESELADLVDQQTSSIAEERALMLLNLQRVIGLPDEQLARVREIFDASPIIGTGNPRASKHPMSRADCVARRRASRWMPADEALCGAPYMVALFDATRESEQDATSCIDQYEFPNVPCEYPLVWVSAYEASELCVALGKRLCDAHEWEGACSGKVQQADLAYSWHGPRIQRTYEHNRARELVWAYGPGLRDELCGTNGTKSPRCVEVTWRDCGSNTFPVGAFPDCVSRLGVYDQHGNVAEHMNLPLTHEELSSRGGVGRTEMKGSWFASTKHRPHPDDCLWRAPAWHATAVNYPGSHANYHLGFRCCKSIPLRSGPE